MYEFAVPDIYADVAYIIQAPSSTDQRTPGPRASVPTLIFAAFCWWLDVLSSRSEMVINIFYKPRAVKTFFSLAAINVLDPKKSFCVLHEFLPVHDIL